MAKKSDRNENLLKFSTKGIAVRYGSSWCMNGKSLLISDNPGSDYFMTSTYFPSDRRTTDVCDLSLTGVYILLAPGLGVITCTNHAKPPVHVG